MQMYSNIRNTSGAAFNLGKWFLLPCVLLSLTGCQSLTNFSEGSKSKLGRVFKPYRPDMVQGNFISKEQVNSLKVGMTYEEVFVLLGTPLHLNVMRQNRFDYISIYKKGNDKNFYQRLVTIHFEDLKLKKIVSDDLPTEYELIAEIDDIKASSRPQRKAIAPELESQHAAPTVQTVPNPTQGVGIPRGDTRN
jgi:outer membrane protein assembly factor BamE